MEGMDIRTCEPKCVSEEFRQKIAALDSDEVEAACYILASNHPEEYIDALRDVYLLARMDLSQVEDVVETIHIRRRQTNGGTL